MPFGNHLGYWIWLREIHKREIDIPCNERLIGRVWESPPPLIYVSGGSDTRNAIDNAPSGLLPVPVLTTYLWRRQQLLNIPVINRCISSNEMVYDGSLLFSPGYFSWNVGTRLCRKDWCKDGSRCMYICYFILFLYALCRIIKIHLICIPEMF